MRFLSLLLLGLCPCGVYVVMWSSLVCLWGCRCTLCGCGGCCDYDACTVVCVVCVYAERVWGCEVDGNAGVGDGCVVVVVSAGLWVWIIYVYGRSGYLYIVLGGYLRILGAPRVQSCCTLWIYASQRVFVYGRYCKSRFVCVCLSDLDLSRHHSLLWAAQAIQRVHCQKRSIVGCVDFSHIRIYFTCSHIIRVYFTCSHIIRVYFTCSHISESTPTIVTSVSPQLVIKTTITITSVSPPPLLPVCLHHHYYQCVSTTIVTSVSPPPLLPVTIIVYFYMFTYQSLLWILRKLFFKCINPFIPLYISTFSFRISVIEPWKRNIE